MQIILQDQKFFLFFSDALLLSLINLVGQQCFISQRMFSLCQSHMPNSISIAVYSIRPSPSQKISNGVWQRRWSLHQHQRYQCSYVPKQIYYLVKSAMSSSIKLPVKNSNFQLLCKIHKKYVRNTYSKADQTYLRFSSLVCPISMSSVPYLALAYSSPSLGPKWVEVELEKWYI